MPIALPLAARCLGFGLRWAAGADARGGDGDQKAARQWFGLAGAAAPGPDISISIVLGGQGVVDVPGWGLAWKLRSAGVVRGAGTPAVSMATAACQTGSPGFINDGLAYVRLPV